MESFVIHIPNKKANLVKQLLKELGVTINAIEGNVEDCNKNHIPNKETLKAIKEVKEGKGIKFASVNDLFASI
ncbi:hypothetical protein EZ456_11570 [Pedobacter psychrodurus]|uniref:Uncharacterized protein n=1 Tax=Pedobacter psychrodurus TaxID=2530456 RepID=A0A4V2MQZ6_9SPHI|nr:hypothetical protein [Pedobacter psychrodurus]TCD27149.1 hypothetical protein EZ456_11570 [Pedobacter psychrodurus]